MTDPALTRARRGALLALVGALLLANPAYVGLAVDEPTPRSPTGYTATAVDPADPEDQATVIETVGSDDLLAVDQLADENEYQTHGDRYRAPSAAASVLRRAASEGTATTDDPDAAFTLRRVLTNHGYVTTGDRGDRTFYRASVADAGDGVRVTLAPVNRSDVVRYLLAHDARLYSGLPAYQRETVDAVLASDRSGYRPTNEEFHELTDRVLVKDGGYYVFQAGIHVDDFGVTARDLVSLALSVLGLLSVLSGGVLTVLSYRGGNGGAGERGPDRP